MDLKELEELHKFNELDLLYKIIERAEGVRNRTEKILKGNKSAGVDVRKTMQDIRILSEIIRDQIQKRKTTKRSANKKTKLENIIESERKRLLREEIRIKNIEQKRITQK